MAQAFCFKNGANSPSNGGGKTAHKEAGNQKQWTVYGEFKEFTVNLSKLGCLKDVKYCIPYFSWFILYLFFISHTNCIWVS